MNYKLITYENVIKCYETSKDNLDSHLYSLIINWVDTNEWIEVIKNTTNNFLTLETRQKSLLIRFSKCLALYFNPEDEQSIWRSYGQIQHYCSSNVETKYRNSIRALLYRFYIFIIDNYKQYADSCHLKSILLKNEIFQGTKIKDPYNILTTNFPSDSKYFQVFSIECRLKNNASHPTVYLSNIYINTANQFIIKTINNYLLKMKKYGQYTKYNTPFYRTFFYHFGSSMPKEISSFTNFNKDTFLDQFRYYKELDKKGEIPSKYNKSIVAELAKFYRYIETEYMKGHGEILFNDPDFNAHLLKSNKLKKSLEEDYKPIVINPYEQIPKSDKWLVIPPLDNKCYNLNMYRAISFEDVLNPISRELLKSHVWNSHTRDPIDRFTHLVQFLNKMEENSSQKLHSKK